MSSFFHKLLHPTGKKQWLTNPGGALTTKLMNNGKTYQGPLGALANPYGPAPQNPNSDPSDPNSPNYNPINQYKPPPDGQFSGPAMRLGWTNGGYNFKNSPWNGQPITPANPMSFSPQPAAGGNYGMTASGPQQLQPGGNPGSMPPAGAQPSGPPTRGGIGVPEQEALIAGLRRA
jgi:hypothetical protein